MPPIEGTGNNDIAIDFSQVWGELPDFTGMFTGGAPGAYVPPASSGGGVTGWLNANAKTVLIGAGVVVGVLFLTGGRRR